MKWLIYFGCFNFFCSVCNSQSSKHAFILNGSINLDSGSVLLMPMSEKGYYDDESLFNERIIQNGQFNIQGTLNYPTMFRVGVKIKSKLEYISDYILVDTGTQKIICNRDSLREIPDISNRPMQEYLRSYSGFFDSLNKDFNRKYAWHDSLRKVFEGKIPNYYKVAYENSIDSLRYLRKKINLRYAKVNPESYVSLWELIYELKGGYEPILDTIYESLGKMVKSSFTGSVLGEKLNMLKALSVGSIFPTFEILDTGMNQMHLNISQNHSKYYLIDFWFSHCKPCLQEFSEFKKLTSLYDIPTFSIIAISVDSNAYIDDWKREIIKINTNWNQVLDLNGFWTSKSSIHVFPTNFLLDRNGVILKRNIEIPQLINFLEKNAN